MTKFSKEINIGGVPTEFQFEHADEEHNELILVTAQDVKSKSYSFTMKQDDTRVWKAQSADIPEMIANEALELSDAINDHLDRDDEDIKRTEGLNPWSILDS